ncbi:hypothetical protein [Thiomicrospira microaerophila]|nr:hypothetical protein [Thiomicrospira microaerophila]
MEPARSRLEIPAFARMTERVVLRGWPEIPAFAGMTGRVVLRG